MKNRLVAHITGISVTAIGYPAERTPKRLLQEGIPYSSKGPLTVKHNKANGVREHGNYFLASWPKIAETLNEKLCLGAKILKAGGMEKTFKHHFRIKEGEKLLKASQCYLSTTAGPIAGLLFISTDKVAFCSERSIKFSSPTGEVIRIRYKVLIPAGKILRANESENAKRPSQKYIQIVTVDNFDFWFMGFQNYRKTFKYLQQAISQAQ